MDEKNIKNYTYVCPYCLGKLEECKCVMFPPTLIQIDRNMLPIIRELNRKFFCTETCCEGHIGSNEYMYIGFARKYKFKNSLPKGFEEIGSFIKANITGRTEQAKKRKKRELLNRIYQWACELESTSTNNFIV